MEESKPSVGRSSPSQAADDPSNDDVSQVPTQRGLLQVSDADVGERGRAGRQGRAPRNRFQPWASYLVVTWAANVRKAHDPANLEEIKNYTCGKGPLPEYLCKAWVAGIDPHHFVRFEPTKAHQWRQVAQAVTPLVRAHPSQKDLPENLRLKLDPKSLQDHFTYIVKSYNEFYVSRLAGQAPAGRDPSEFPGMDHSAARKNFLDHTKYGTAVFDAYHEAFGTDAKEHGDAMAARELGQKAGKGLGQGAEVAGLSDGGCEHDGAREEVAAGGAEALAGDAGPPAKRAKLPPSGASPARPQKDAGARLLRRPGLADIHPAPRLRSGTHVGGGQEATSPGTSDDARNPAPAAAGGPADAPPLLGRADRDRAISSLTQAISAGLREVAMADVLTQEMLALKSDRVTMNEAWKGMFTTMAKEKEEGRERRSKEESDAKERRYVQKLAVKERCALFGMASAILGNPSSTPDERAEAMAVFRGAVQASK